jgi:hypothetical protein
MPFQEIPGSGVRRKRNGGVPASSRRRSGLLGTDAQHGPENRKGSEILLLSGDLDDFGIEGSLLTQCHPEDVAAAQLQLNSLRPGHQAGKFDSLFGLLIKLKRPFQCRVRILDLGSHDIFSLSQLLLQLGQLGLGNLNAASGITQLNRQLERNSGTDG